MQFIVPQFIDTEDRIIGPITTRQFIMGVVAALLIFLAYRFSDLSLFIIETVLIVGFYALVAFVKVNGSPFYYFLLNIAQGFKKPKLRVWQKNDFFFKAKPAKEDEKKEEPKSVPIRKRLVDQELSALALLVDTGGRYNPEDVLKKYQEKNTKSEKK